MPQWFDDHLHCATPMQWLPALLAQPRARMVGARPPRALRRALDGCTTLGEHDDALDVLVHCGELWGPLGLERSTMARLRSGAVLVDLAWVEVWAGAWKLQAWRRAPGQRAAAARLSAVIGLGLHEPQQWVTDHRLALVITLAVARS